MFSLRNCGGRWEHIVLKTLLSDPVSGFPDFICRTWQLSVFFLCGCFLAKMICSLLQIAANGNNSTGKEPGECQTFLEMPQSLLMRGLACSTICQGCAFIINQLWRQHELKCHQKRGNKSVLAAVHLLQGKICEQKVGLSVLNK